MTTPPRRLTFSVGASLLTASLAMSSSACDEQPQVNPASAKSKGTDQPTVNEGPEPQPQLNTNVGRERGFEPTPAPEPAPEPAPSP